MNAPTENTPNLPVAPVAGLSQALTDAGVDRRLDVLRRVAAGSSISQAAREVGVSYKAAWQAIDTLTNLSGQTLVDRSVGGSGGGGARITAQGLQLLALADALAQARATVLARFDSAPLAAASLGLQTSMRNQLACRVMSCSDHEANEPTVRVTVQTPGAAMLVASITRESADLLGLVPGVAVLVLCKATAVDMLAGEGPVDGPASAAVLPGRVARVSPGRTRDEVVLALPGGGHWVGFAGHPFLVAEGGPACAVMAAQALVLAR